MKSFSQRPNALRLVLSGGLLFLLLAVIITPTSASTSVFINEIHYDNTGSDTGEAVEVAGPAGTDLGGWSIALYNGNGGAVYDTITMSGVIPDLGDGYGTLAFSKAGIQNGGPDGLALVNGSTVVQFLSYEGTFTAVGGPADTMTSTDIGVDEPYTTPVGDSLQLTGTGTDYEDFAWASPAPNTFGSINTGQTFSSSGSGSPFINELHYDNTGSDTGEGVEVAGPAGTDLSGWSIELYNGNGGASYGTITLSGIIPDQDNGYGTLDFPKASIQNGGPDGLALVNGSTVVQFLSYEGSFTAVGGPADGMTSEDIGVDEPYTTPVGDSLQLTGTGTAYADFTWASAAPNTFGAVNTGQSFGGTPPDPCPDVIPIADVQGPGDSTLLSGTEVTIQGLVTARYGSEFLVQENTSDPRSGVIVYSSGNSVAVGDEVCVTGVASERFGQTQVGGNYNPSAAISVLSTGNTLPDPAVVSTSEIATGSPDAEQWEGVFVKVEFAYVTDDALGYGEFAVDDGSGPARVDDKGSITYSPTNGDFLTFVQGPLFYAYGDFKIEPRDDADIGLQSAACNDPFTPIYAVQGSDPTTPLADNNYYTVEGVVTADFDGLSGFFIQDITGDGDPNTSDGVFVYSSADVAVGQEVRFAGKASEYYYNTQLGYVKDLVVCGAGIEIAPTEVFLPAADTYALEIYEGMLVTFPQPLYISEYYGFAQYGEIVLTTERQFQATALVDGGTPEADQILADNALGRITLDDGKTSWNPDPAIHPDGAEFTMSNLFRGGDAVQAVTGVLNYAHGDYRVQPTTGANFTSENPRTAAPDAVGGNLKIASFNVLNYFTTFGERGADNQEEFDRQRTKIFAALAAIDADIVGLIEIENNGLAIADLVSGLNDLVGAGTYAYVDTGVIGTDAITVAYIYKPATVSLFGDFAVLDAPSFTDPNSTGQDKNRPALAQTFMDIETGGIFTAAVNHLKSKGSSCGAGDDDAYEGSCSVTRTLAAQALTDWLATDPTSSGDADFLIMGDLNAYDKENPIDAVIAGADDTAGTADDYTDLVFQFLGENAYSYVFDGQLGYLDHALANQEMLPEVTGTTIWHINADEPSIIDYDTSYKKPAQDALWAPDAYRSSDHDPVIVGLNVCDEIAPTMEISADIDTLWPANHKYVKVTFTVVAADNFDLDPTIELLSVQSNEADEGPGKKDKANDIRIKTDFIIKLRAERFGRGDGRIYTITYKVTDACGNETIESIEIYVPHDMKPEK